MIFILRCFGRDPTYQGKSGVVWAREVLVYQVKLILPLILPLLIMHAALPCLFNPFISLNIFLNVIIVTIVQVSERNTKVNKMQENFGEEHFSIASEHVGPQILIFDDL